MISDEDSVNLCHRFRPHRSSSVEMFAGAKMPMLNSLGRTLLRFKAGHVKHSLWSLFLIIPRALIGLLSYQEEHLKCKVCSVSPFSRLVLVNKVHVSLFGHQRQTEAMLEGVQRCT